MILANIQTSLTKIPYTEENIKIHIFATVKKSNVLLKNKISIRIDMKEAKHLR